MAHRDTRRVQARPIETLTLILTIGLAIPVAYESRRSPGTRRNVWRLRPLRLVWECTTLQYNTHIVHREVIVDGVTTVFPPTETASHLAVLAQE